MEGGDFECVVFGWWWIDAVSNNRVKKRARERVCVCVIDRGIESVCVCDR